MLESFNTLIRVFSKNFQKERKMDRKGSKTSQIILYIYVHRTCSEYCGVTFEDHGGADPGGACA